MVRHGVAVLADPDHEGDLVRAIDAQGEDLVVVRRCADLAEMRAAAGAGVADLVVIDGSDPDLDRETVLALVGARVGVVLLAPRGEESRLTHLGAPAVVTRGRPDEAVRALVRLANRAPEAPAPPPPPPTGPSGGSTTGRIVTVWGTSGAPGRTTTAIEVARALAASGPTVLVDADTTAPTLAHLLGLPTDVSVLAAMCRLASRGALDALEVAGAALPTPHGVGVLTGVSAPQRWREITPGALADVLGACREVAATTVVDVHAGSLDPLASHPARGGRDEVLAAALRACDTALLLVRGDAVGLARCARSLLWWEELGLDTPLVPVVNRVAPRGVGRRPATTVAQAMGVLVPHREIHIVPEDPQVPDAQLRATPLGRLRPRSPAAQAWSHLAGLVGSPPAR